MTLMMSCRCCDSGMATLSPLLHCQLQELVDHSSCPQVPDAAVESSRADPFETFDFRGRRTGVNLGFGQQASSADTLLTWDKLRQVLASNNFL